MKVNMGSLVAFVVGTIVGYKWPTIRKALRPVGETVERGAVKGYLAVKEGASGVASHFRSVADDVKAEA